jgi:signal peptidase I
VPDTDKKPDPRELKSKKEKKKKKHKGRELVECLLVAGILALTIRQFGFQIFKIPTRSMEPALYGNEYYGDRVVAMMWYNRGKLGLKLGEVRRWQVLVFNHKIEGKPTNYIKRVVGLPGEHVEIRDGDVWVAAAGEENLKIARKPRGLQEDLWIKLCDLDFSDPRRMPYYWDATPEESAEVKDGKLLLRSTPEKMSRLEWRSRGGIDNRFIRLTVKRVTCENKIKDKAGKERICGREFKAVFDTARPLVFCPNPECKKPVWGVHDKGGEGLLVRDTPKTRHMSNYWTEHEDGGTDVPDIRLKMDFEALEGAGKIEAVLTCRAERFGLVIPLGGRESKVELYREVRPGKREIVGQKTLTLTAGSRHRLELINVDAEVRAEIDGVEIGTHPYVPPDPGRSDVDITVSGSLQLAIDNLRLYRDIYYGHTTGRPHEDWKETGRMSSGMILPEKSYFFLGDNSLASADGRAFGPKKERDIVARGLFVAWPLSRMHWIK